MKNKIIFFLLFSIYTFFPSKYFPQNFWEETNGPKGGLVQCLALGKDNSIFAGFYAGQFGPSHGGRGIYKSGNLGQSWTNISPYTNKDIQSITVDTSGTIFLWSKGAGIFKSTNNGYSWTGMYFGSQGNGIIVSLSNNYIALAQYEGVFISSNSGSSWYLSSLTEPVYHLFVDNENNIYATTNNSFYRSSDYGSTWNNVPSLNYVTALCNYSETVLLAGSSNGIYFSLDKGVTWNHFTHSPGDITALNVGTNRYIYAGTRNGFFVSTDRGRSWFSKNDGLKSLNITSSIILPPNKLIIGTYGDGLYASDGNNLYWSSVNTGIKSVSITAFYKYKNYLLAGSDAGIIYKSSNNGNSWENIDSVYTQLEINDFISSIKNSLFFCNNEGIFKSIDDGESWVKTKNLITRSFTSFYDSSSGIEYLFASTFGGMYRSTDDGKSWLLFNSGLSFNHVYKVVSNSIGYVFAAGTDKIYRSTDFGETWIYIPVNIGYYTSYNMCITVSANDFIYAGFAFGGLHLSTDNGDNWINLLYNLPLIRVNSVTTDPFNNVYAGNWDGYVYQSGDFGQHWNDIHSGLIGGPVLNLFCDDEGNIFVGPVGGSVYKGINSTFLPPAPTLSSPAQGSHSHPLTLDLKWFPINSANNYRLQVSSNNSFDSLSILYDITLNDTLYGLGPLEENTIYYWRVSCSNNYGAGQWSLSRYFKTMRITSMEDILSGNFSYELNQNFPNPFNPSTSIQYSVGGRQFVTLKVYDVLSREITTLVNEEKYPGVYEVEFNASDLSSGIYYYQLKAGNFTETKKLIFIK